MSIFIVTAALASGTTAVATRVAAAVDRDYTLLLLLIGRSLQSLRFCCFLWWHSWCSESRSRRSAEFLLDGLATDVDLSSLTFTAGKSYQPTVASWIPSRSAHRSSTLLVPWWSRPASWQMTSNGRKCYARTMTAGGRAGAFDRSFCRCN